MSPSSPARKIALTGQFRAASSTSSVGAPSGSTTIALPSSSSWKTSGAVETQSPEPMQRSRSTSTRMRFLGESSAIPKANGNGGPARHQVWDELAWVQVLDGVVIEEIRADAGGVSALREKYPAYRDRLPPGPLLHLVPERVLF